MLPKISGEMPADGERVVLPLRKPRGLHNDMNGLWFVPYAKYTRTYCQITLKNARLLLMVPLVSLPSPPLETF